MSEKDGPPSYPVVMQPESSPIKPKKWLFGLLFYAGAVTAALVTLAVLGSIYMNKMEHACANQRPMPGSTAVTPSGNTKKYERDDQEYEVDEEADKEIIRLTGEQFGKGSIVVHDFKKGVTGVYNAMADECYLIGGIDNRVPSAREIVRQFEAQSEPTMNVTVNYGKADDRPVHDLTLLPRELHDVCWGKEVYWLERLPESGPDDDTPSSRQKRATCTRLIVTVNRCYVFCCSFCVRNNGVTTCYRCSYMGRRCK